MDSKGRVRASDEESEARSSPRPDQATSQARTVTLGLVAAPEIPERIAYELAGKLPDLLSMQIDERVSWEVSVVCDPLVGSNREAPELLEETQKRMQQEGWDLAICLTDLPVRRGGQLVVADASGERGVGGISLPILGVTLLRRRVREAVLQLVSEMYWGSSDSERGHVQKHEQSKRNATSSDGSDDDAGEIHLRGRYSRQLIGRRLTERLAPIRRTTPTDEGVDVRFVSPRGSGDARLLAGMVLANRPWRLFTTMKSTLAATFATGAYALIITTIWLLADIYGLPRLLALMVLSIVAMVVWIIVAHNLWEKPSERVTREWAAFYNAATAITISVAVIFSYAVLFILILAAAWFFVPGSYFGTTVKHSVGFGDYVILAWMVSSLATVAGALGSGLEDDETVRNATYGYRQRRRAEKTQDDSTWKDSSAL